MMKAFVTLREKAGKFFIPFIMLAFSLVLFLLMYSAVKPTDLDIQLYQVADSTIRANATVEDTEQTQENRRIAAENVAPVYSFNSDTRNKQLTKVQMLFAAIEETQKEIKASSLSPALEKEEGEASVASPAEEPLTSEQKYQLFQGEMANLEPDVQEFIQAFPQWAVVELLSASGNVLTLMNDTVTSIVSEKMAEPIRSDQLNLVVEDAQDSLQYTELNSTYQRVAELVLNHTIVENNIFNEQATEQARQEASKNVQPVMILQGQVIVQEGHVIDGSDIHQMELLGMLDDEPSYAMLYSLMVVLAAQLLALYLIVRIDAIPFERVGKMFVLYSLIVILSVGLMKGLQLIQLSGINHLAFLFPAALAPILVNAFLTPKFAYLVNALLPVFSIYIYTDYRGTTNALVIALVYAMNGLFGSLTPQQKAKKVSKPLFFFMVAAHGIVMLAMVFYLHQPLFTMQSGLMILYSVLSGVIAYVSAMILTPYIDVYYDDNAVLTLTELSSPNQPLLKMLLTKTPGTYHHSLMVANLSSNAVSAIGGDALFARVACYYHDVGKLTHPLFFVENLPQGMDNPHHLLSPYESKEIIFGHVSKGVKMLQEAKLPQSIIDICAQHHGTTLMKYFYAEAKKENEEVNELDFRYPGPKPQTKEAAVINIADSAEAACRSMKNPSKEKIEEFVYQLIVGRVKDGQFDECDITMKELKIVEASLVENLIGTFHNRIEYPKNETVEKK